MSTLYGMTVTFGGGSISGGTVPQVTVNAPTGSTVTAKKGDVTLTAAEKNGVWVFDLPEFGTWVITATDGTNTVTESVVFEGTKVLTFSYFSATIAVTYPAGSTCTCSNGATTLTAPDTSGSCTFIVTGTGIWSVYCSDGDNYATQDVEILHDGQTVTAELSYGALPAFTYTGDYALKTAADYGLSGDYDVLALLTSGTLNFTSNFDADAFLVGAGGGGSGHGAISWDAGAGGGGGYTKTSRLSISGPLTATIGVGGSGVYTGTGGQGGNTSIGNISAAGGNGGAIAGGNGGSGGGAEGRDANGAQAGGAGGSNGSNGYTNTTYAGGAGQGTTTRAFGEDTATLFAGGGGGGSVIGTGGAGGDGGGGAGGAQVPYGGSPGNAGAVNTGGGGGGAGGSTASSATQYGGAGGSGIILIRRAQ